MQELEESRKATIISQYESALRRGSLGVACLIEHDNPGLATELARIRSRVTGIIIPTTGNYI